MSAGSSHSKAGSSRFHILTGRLEVVRKHHLTTRLQADVLSALAVTAWIFSVLTLIQWPVSREAPYATVLTVTGSLSVLLASFGVAVGRFLLARPDHEWYARRIDLHYGFPETVSTALELRKALTVRNPVTGPEFEDPDYELARPRTELEFARDSTLDEALRVSAHLDGTRFSTPVRARAPGLGFGMAALLLAFIPAVVDLPLRTPAPASDDFMAEVTRTVELLEELEPMVEETEYIRAIRRELERLAADVEGVEFIPLEVQEGLLELVRHAETALAGEPEAWQAFAETIAGAQALFADEREAGQFSAAEFPGRSPGSRTDVAGSDGVTVGDSDDGGARADELSAAEALGNREGDGGGELMYAREVLEYDPRRSEYNQVVPELARLRETLEQLQAQYAMPVGEGKGEQAGVFGNDEFAADGRLLAGQDGEDFVLPAVQEASRTVRVDAPVEENLVAVADVQLTVGEWRRMDEDLIYSEHVPIEYREIVGRYFERVPGEELK